MKPDVIQAYAAIAQTVIALLALIATILLTYFIYRYTVAIAKLEYTRSIRAAWLTIDSIALSSDEMLKIADSLMDPNATPNNDPIELQRKRWFAFMVYGILDSIHEGHKKKFLKDEDAKLAFEQLLFPLIRDSNTYIITQSRGHTSGFSTYCRKMREAYEKTLQMHKAQAEEDKKSTSDKL